MKITFQRDPITLVGTQKSAGDSMPDFCVTDKSLGQFTLANTSGAKIFLTVPSVDTPVCDLEIRTFNERIAKLPHVKIYVVSMDLPFAQARWCGAAGIEAVEMLSDYKDRDFGKKTGTYIQELGLLTRAAFVVDRNDKIVYAEYVPEVTNPPDYDKILREVT